MPTLAQGDKYNFTIERMPSLEDVYQKVRTTFVRHHPNGDVDLLDKAFTVGKSVHISQYRNSGESYFFHPLAVATFLAEWHLDAVSIACGLLHDTVEDTRMTNDELRRQFGGEVADIVDGLTKISKLDLTDQVLLNAENICKLLVAMDKDVRVLLIKLADRLHNMRTLGYMQEDKRRRIAHETIELYAPLANRLGMGLVRAELEDLAFANLEPECYLEMKQIMDVKRKKSASMIEDIKKTLMLTLRMHGMPVEIFFRVKHLYGIWVKMGVQEKKIEDIHDWLAYRVICPSRESCYTALGLVHALYRPIPGRFKDYISLPKDNGYQSIHTIVLMPTGDSFEVQFRTKSMDEHAEVGIAAHWTYKDGRIANKQELNQASFLRRMVELYKGTRDSRELVANLKGELKFQQIQVFTPKGDLRSLPENATPIDFAYAIHTEIGNRCVGAKVNGRIVSLKHVLQNGDRIEVFTRADQKPSRNWLSIVASAKAKANIQTFIREEEREHAIISGKERFESEAKAFDIKLDELEIRSILKARLKELKFSNWDAFYASIGFNRVNPKLLLEPLITKAKKSRGEDVLTVEPSGILADSNIGTLYILADCCKPILGDEIVGYATRDGSVSIHRIDCSQLHLSSPNQECLVSVIWGNISNFSFSTELIVKTDDRRNMVAVISTAVQNAGFNLQGFSGGISDQSVGIFYMALRVKDRNQLNELISSIRKLSGVLTVARVRGSYFGNIH